MALGGSLAGVAKVVLRVDDEQYNRDLSSAQQRFHHTTGEIEKDSGRLTRGALAGSGAFHSLGRSLVFASGAFLGAAGFTAVVKDSINAASDLHEQVNKAEVVFRTSGEEIERWGGTTARSMGIAEHQALGLAATFGNLLVPMGFARDRAEDMSKRMVQLASDMASFNNASPEDTLRAIQSGLAGQVRPLREYGVFLSQARIQHELLTAGVHGTWKELTAAQKAWATYQIILKDTRDAQGDFARTSGGLANQQRILRAEVTDLEAKLGKALLPSIISVVHAVTEWLGQSKNQQRVQHDVTEAVNLATGAFRAIKSVIDTVNRATGGLKNTLELLLALKLAFVVSRWTVALTALAGAASAGTGAAGATAATGALARNLRILTGFAAKPIQIVIAYEIIRKLTGSNADLSNDAGGPGDLNPVFRNGKWVDPVSGTPVADQAYWNRQLRRSTPGGSTSTAAAARQGAVVQTARQLGPGSSGVYVTGGTGGRVLFGSAEHIGYDCSGYLYDIYRRNGITIPRTSETQWADPKALKVPKGQEQPGDGVYFTGSSEYPPPGHCGIYIGGGKFIEYYRSGQPARVSNLADQSDYWGARRWIKIKQQASGGTTAPDTGPPAGTATAPAAKKQTKADAPDLTAIPAGLHLALADAGNDASAQVKVLTQFLAVLEQRKRAASKVADQADIQDTINDIRDKISGIRKGQQKDPKAPVTVDLTAMPENLRLRFQNAVGRNDAEQQIKLLLEFERILERRKQLAKKIAAKADIQTEINNVRDQVAGLRGTPDQPDKTDPLKSYQATIDRTLQTIRDIVAGAHPGLLQTKDVTDATAAIADAQEGLAIAQSRYAAAVKKYGDSSVQAATAQRSVVHAEAAVAAVQAAAAKGTAGKVVSRAFIGAPSVKIDPKTGKYIVVQVKPDVDALKVELDYLLKKVLPKIDAEIRELKAAIARLSKHPKKNKTQLAAMRAKLAAKQAERKEVVALAVDIAVSINDINAAIAIDPEPEQTGGADVPTSVPEDTSGGGGDGGGGPSGPTPEQLQQQATEAANAQTFSYLTGLRALQSFEPNIVSNPALRALIEPGSAALAGATITVNNFNQQTPVDPHAFSNQLVFELKALVG